MDLKIYKTAISTIHGHPTMDEIRVLFGVRGDGEYKSIFFGEWVARKYGLTCTNSRDELQKISRTKEETRLARYIVGIWLEKEHRKIDVWDEFWIIKKERGHINDIEELEARQASFRDRQGVG